MARPNVRTANQQRPRQPLINGVQSVFPKGKSNPYSRFHPLGALFAAAVAVILAVFLYQSLFISPKGGNSKISTFLSEDNLSKLESITSEVEKQPTALLFGEMMEVSTRVGGFLELALLQMVTESEETPENEVISVYDHTLLQRSGKVIRRTVDIAYETLLKLLRGVPNANFHLPSEHSPRMLFSWMVSTAQMYNAVLTEFYLREDNTYHHAVSLIRSVNVLGWAPSTHANFFNWSESPCQSSYEAASEKWTSFCEKSCTSLTTIATRQAASYEELIALYPRYAPFRLHYLFLLALGEIPHAKSEAVLQTIHAQRKGLSTYTNVDGFHSSWLDLLEFHVRSSDQRSAEKVDNTRKIVRGLLQSCGNLSSHHFIKLNHVKHEVHWPGTFSNEIRPPLLTRAQSLNFIKKTLPIMNAQEEAIILEAIKECQ
ncbi:unnamed protein product [Phytomonas sp. Hart1]|nr:unnamed protein product [Phytomonas sp. Hart1]|eukprot:CCW69943.1 unnamed protein product [Phytomonas sp. isolate Hart1]